MSYLQVLLVGVNHKTAPLEVRERLAFTSGEIPEALRSFGRLAQGPVILSTCNRTEIYCGVEDMAEGMRQVRELWAQSRDLPLETIERYLFVASGIEAARHLFRVSAGTDSMIVGEAQILGQVKAAYQMATATNQLPISISHLFHQALKVGKRARTETDISRHAVSISSAGAELARRTFGDLEQCRVLVISAGQAGKLTAKSLKSLGASQLVVLNRTYERAVEVARELGGTAVPFHELPAALASSDVVVSATDSSELVVTADMVRRAMAARGGPGLIFIDLAVPRDIDPQARAIPGVALFDVDDLRVQAGENLHERTQEVKAVEAIVEGEVEKFSQWWSSRQALSVIAALEKRAEAIRRSELKKTLKRLPDLSGEGHERIEALSRAIVNKILHAPVSTLRDRGDDDGYIQAARQLFDLDGKEP